MTWLAMNSRIGRIGAVVGTALAVAAVTTAPKPAQAGGWVEFGVGVPAWTYAPPPPAYGYAYSYSYPYTYTYSYPSYGYYVGRRFGGWHHHRHWRDWDDDDD